MSGTTKREAPQGQAQKHLTRPERDRLARERFESHFGEVNVPQTVEDDLGEALRRLRVEIVRSLQNGGWMFFLGLMVGVLMMTLAHILDDLLSL